MTTQHSGALQKLQWEFPDGPASASTFAPAPMLQLGETRLAMADFVGARLRLYFKGVVHCSHCGRTSKRSFGQGYCYPCFKKLARCDLCIMSPTRCHFAQGTCREPEWAQGFCFAPHSVYLANSSGLKVGITGRGRELNRWVDQGAAQAQVLLDCDSRQLAGELEALLATHMSDRTHWRALLGGDAEPLDLAAAREQAIAQLGPLPQGARVADSAAIAIRYPITRYGPAKSVNLEKSPLFESVLLGAKGQYLLFEEGAVNVRRHTGFEIELHGVPSAPPPAAPQMEFFND